MTQKYTLFINMVVKTAIKWLPVSNKHSVQYSIC